MFGNKTNSTWIVLVNVGRNFCITHRIESVLRIKFNETKVP